MTINTNVRSGSCVNGGTNGGWLSLENIYQITNLIVIYYKTLLTNGKKVTKVIRGNGYERI